MATGSSAERLRHLTRPEPVVLAGDQAPFDDAAEDTRLDMLELYGNRDGQPCIEVPNVFEATQHCTFELGGRPYYLRGPSAKGRLGTLVEKGHFLLKAHPELFTPLKLPVDFRLDDPAG